MDEHDLAAAPTGARAKVDALVPLFAVGLFSAFTLSQTGMVVHHWRLRHSGWRRSLR